MNGDPLLHLPLKFEPYSFLWTVQFSMNRTVFYEPYSFLSVMFYEAYLFFSFLSYA